MTDTAKPIIPQGPGIWLTDAEHRTLLDAKEAAERDRDAYRAARIAYASEFPLTENGEEDVGSIHANIRKLKSQLTEARASAAAAWEAASLVADTVRVAGASTPRQAANIISHALRTNPDPSATEALRRVKEAAWERGYAIGTNAGVQQTWGDSPNPYAAKEAAHD